MIRYVDVRVDVYRSGGKLTELSPLDEEASIMMSSSGEIKTSLQGTFRPNPLVNWLTDELRPILIIDSAEHPCGVFLPATVMTADNGIETSVEVTGYDRCWLLQTYRTEEILHFSAGDDYLDAIHMLLTRAGISLYYETSSTAVFQTDREDWDVGTDYLTIINDLLREMSYKELWFDAHGAAVIEPQATPDAAHIQHILSSEQVESLIRPEKSVTSDIFDKPNVFICICSNPDLDEPMTAVAVNDNPQSPLSVQRRGRRIAAVEKVDNVPDQAALQAYANHLVIDSMMSSDTVTITTGLLPSFGVEDVVALSYGNENGIFIETDWSLTLTAGAVMTHTLRKVAFMLG